MRSMLKPSDRRAFTLFVPGQIVYILKNPDRDFSILPLNDAKRRVRPPGDRHITSSIVKSSIVRHRAASPLEVILCFRCRRRSRSDFSLFLSALYSTT